MRRGEPLSSFTSYYDSGAPICYFFVVLFFLLGGVFFQSLEARADAQSDGYAAFKRGDYAEAFRIWRPLAKSGDAIAQYNIGWMYDQGMGVDQSDREAIIWYKKSANQGEIDAQYTLALKYGEGQDVRQDFKMSLNWLDAVTKQENDQWLRTVEAEAEAGKVYAQFALGYVYQHGLGFDIDAYEASDWYHAAAEGLLPLAYFQLGLLYQDRNSVLHDQQEALRWYKKSESSGDFRAYLKLGELYHYGGDAIRDYAKAMSWYKKANLKGSAQAQLNIGELYYNGQGVKQDYSQAFQFVDKVATRMSSRLVKTITQDAEDGLVYKQIVLGYLFQTGKGIGKDLKATFKWMMRAADQGDGFAQRNVGLAYENGYGVSKDPSAALHWYREGVVSGDIESQALLEKLESYLEEERIAKAKKEEEERIAKAKTAKKYCDEVEPAVKDAEVIGSGTAFVVNKTGIAMTNAHVIDQCRVVTTWDRDSHFRATVIAKDDYNDLAAIRTCRVNLSKEAVFRQGSPALRQGDDVIAVGFPYADSLSTEQKITQGIVNSLAGWRDDTATMQISAEIQPGNSGGPLFDRSGHVVGVVVARKGAELSEMADDQGEPDIYFDVPQNVNFAIKGSVAMQFLDTNRIEYVSSRSDVKLDIPDIADLARAFTTLVVCWQ